MFLLLRPGTPLPLPSCASGSCRHMKTNFRQLDSSLWVSSGGRGYISAPSSSVFQFAGFPVKRRMYSFRAVGITWSMAYSVVPSGVIANPSYPRFSCAQQTSYTCLDSMSMRDVVPSQPSYLTARVRRFCAREVRHTGPASSSRGPFISHFSKRHRRLTIV